MEKFETNRVICLDYAVINVRMVVPMYITDGVSNRVWVCTLMTKLFSKTTDTEHQFST